MVIADRLRAIREQKNMSQGDIEKRTGLLRCYISRVENGHTVPAIETLEKNGASDGSSDVCALLRWRETTQTNYRGGCYRLGQFRSRRKDASQISQANESGR